MSLAPWRDAEYERDAKSLSVFECALPHPPSSKPASWEKSVQRFFQEDVWRKLEQLRDADPHFRVLEDDHGIAAAYTHNRLEGTDGFHVQDGYGSRLIGFLAIATRYRRQGGDFANQVLIDALWNILDAEKDCERGVFVWGKVHRRNVASKAMLTRNGWKYRASVPDLGPLEHWLFRVDR